jgi:hypothetical protein
MLDAAEEAVAKIKNNIAQIHEVPNYTTFPRALASIVVAFIILLYTPTGTAAVKAQMRDHGFCMNLLCFPKKNVSKQTLKRLQLLMKSTKLNQEIAVNM